MMTTTEKVSTTEMGRAVKPRSSQIQRTRYSEKLFRRKGGAEETGQRDADLDGGEEAGWLLQHFQQPGSQLVPRSLPTSAACLR